MSEESENTQANMETKQIIEGLLMAAGKPLPISKIAEVFTDQERPEPDELKAALKDIESDCEVRGFELKKVASGYRFQVKQEFGEWVGKLWDEKPQRYSRALLETLSIIAYRQPITRGEIEKIRGVAVSTSIIRTLMEREWVRIVGHRDVPGRPAMYASTRQFLDYFNLKSLDELPPLSEIRDIEDLDPGLPLEDDLPESRVLEFPGVEEMEDDFDVPDQAEEEAAAIGTRPIEEILGIEAEAEDLLDEDMDEDEEKEAEAGDKDQQGEQDADSSPQDADSQVPDAAPEVQVANDAADVENESENQPADDTDEE